MYSRLILARDLLTDDGVIFISIGEDEFANLKLILNEIFDERNFVGSIINQCKKGGGNAKFIIRGHEYILVYAKDISKLKLQKKKSVSRKDIIVKNGKSYFVNDDYLRKSYGKYDKSLNDRRCFYEEIESYYSKAKKQEIDKLIASGILFLRKNKFGLHTICELKSIDSLHSKLYSVIRALTSEANSELESLDILDFPYSKPVSLIKTLIDSATDANSIVLDFFAGSFTTGHAVMELNKEDGGNRRFILIQDSSKVENSDRYDSIFELGLDRLRKASQKIGISPDIKVFLLYNFLG